MENKTAPYKINQLVGQEFSCCFCKKIFGNEDVNYIRLEKAVKDVNFLEMFQECYPDFVSKLYKFI